MMTKAVYLAIGLLLVWAIRRKPRPMPVVLGLAFLLAIGAAAIAPGHHVKPILMGLDALIVMAAWYVWTGFRSDRANLIAWIGLVKIMVGVLTASSLPYLAWAIVNNSLFVVMVLVAGGFADGFLAWLGRCLARTGARGAGVLRYLERFE